MLKKIGVSIATLFAGVALAQPQVASARDWDDCYTKPPARVEHVRVVYQRVERQKPRSEPRFRPAPPPHDRADGRFDRGYRTGFDRR